MNEQTPQESAGVPCYHFQILKTYNTETPKSTKLSYLKDRDMGEMAGPSSPPVLLRTEDRGAGLPAHRACSCFLTRRETVSPSVRNCFMQDPGSPGLATCWGAGWGVGLEGKQHHTCPRAGVHPGEPESPADTRGPCRLFRSVDPRTREVGCCPSHKSTDWSATSEKHEREIAPLPQDSNGV